jgi:hypothetical protein
MPACPLPRQGAILATHRESEQALLQIQIENINEPQFFFTIIPKMNNQRNVRRIEFLSLGDT